MDISGLIKNEFIDSALILTDELQQNKYTNVLLIDCTVPAYQTFVSSVNANTLPLVYSTDCSGIKLMELLRNHFTNIPRLGFCFVTPENNTSIRFVDNKPLFGSVDAKGKPTNNNVQFVLNLINEFSIKNIDFLGCNTLNYPNWKTYYDLLSQSTGVIVGASDDKTGNLKYGGDWIMETTSQDIELVYFTESIANYSYLLDNIQWITSTTSPFVSPIQPQPLAMVSDGTYIYGSYNNTQTGSIFRIHIENKVFEPSWVSNLELRTFIWQMIIHNGQLYGTLASGSVFRINTANTSDAVFNLFTKESDKYLRGIAVSDNKLYITSYSTYNIYVYNLQTSQIETRSFIGTTISAYYSSLSITPTATNVGLGPLFIYNNYLYGATNETNASLSRVFKWSLTNPTTDNSMNFMAQGTDLLISNSILPDRIGSWTIVDNQLYFVRNDAKNVISRLNLNDLTDYVYNYYTIVATNTTINSGLVSDNTYLYFQDNKPNLTQINLIRPTTPTPTVSIDVSNTYTVSYGNLQVTITDPSNGLNDVYYQYSITGVNGGAYQTANTFSRGASSFLFYINNLFSLTDISYTINVLAKNALGISNTASQTVILYTLPKDITNCSVVYANGNINVSITETSPTTYYYLNNVSYLYYLYTTGANQFSNVLAYTIGANITSASYTTNFAIPNIPVTTSKYRIYLIARSPVGNTVANAFSTNVYSIPSATVSFDSGNTKTVASGNLKVQLIDPSNISINDVYYYYSINNNVDASFANTFVRANVSPYSFFIPSITDISNTIYVKAFNPIGNSSPSANLQVIVYQSPRQPTIQLDLVGSGNVQVTITENNSTPYYYLNNVSYYLYAYNNFGGTNLSGNTSLLIYNRPVGILSNTNSTYDKIVSYVNTGLNANTYTMYVIATNPFGISTPVFANITVYIHVPLAPSIDVANTGSFTSGNLTVSIIDNVNRLDNGIFYWYSTDNISYSNSGVAKTSSTSYQFTINNTGDKNVPLVAGTYTLYVRAYNALGYATSNPVTVKVYTTPQAPTIVAENTYLTIYNRLIISIIDSVNSSTNEIYYWYSTDNISYSNSGVAKSFGISYQFTVSDTGNPQIPLSSNGNYSLYIRAQNPLGNVTTTIFPVTIPTRNIGLSRWLEYEKYSNKFNQTYFRNFVDINGECIVRNGSLIVDYDGTFSGNVYCSKNLQLGGSAAIQTDLAINKNAFVNSNISVKETANLNRLTTTGDASFNTNVFVNNNTNLNKLLVAGDSSFNGNMVVLRNTTLNSFLTVNKDTTLIGKIYGADDATFASKMVVAQDTTLQSSLSVYGITNLYGYRSYPVLNFLRTVNIQAEYNFSDRSSSVDPVNSDALISNPSALNAFTNTIDASIESTSKVNVSSAGINYYYAGGNPGRFSNNGGLLTNPYPLRNITNVTVHMLVNFVSTNSTISWNFLEILTQTDASYSSLYTFKLISNNGMNADGSNNRFTISNNNSTSSQLTNSAFKSGTNIWISISQNIINGDSTIYLNGNILCSFTSVVAVSPLQQYIVYSVGYSRSVSILDQTVNNGAKTIKRIILDYNGKYANTYVPEIINVFNTYNTLYVQPVFTLNSDSIAVNGNANIQNNVNIAGNAKINNKLSVTGDTSFESNLLVSKTANISQQLNVVGDVSFGSKLYIANDTNLNKKLTVIDDASFNKNIGANTISIIGDVSFVSPTGTLYANNIKLKRIAGTSGTTTSIDSNTISTGLINVDSLNATNGIFPNYITASGLITAAQFTSPTQYPLQYPTTINGGAITADSITVDGTETKSKTIICRNLQVNDGLITRGTIQGAVIISDTTLSSTQSITCGKEMKAASFATAQAIVPVDSDGSVYAEKLVRASMFAVRGQPEVIGQLSGEKVYASETITADREITGESFKTTNQLFSVSSSGVLTAASLVINGTITIAGGTELATINATNTISAGGEITGASFKTTNSSCKISSNGIITAASLKTNDAPVAADAGGISVTTIKASGTISSTGAISSGGVVSGTSFTINGKTPVAGQVTVDKVNASETIIATGAITGSSFKTTNASDPDAGGISVTTVKASGALTSGGAITSGGEITATTFKTASAPTNAQPDTGGISVTTVKASGAITGGGAITSTGAITSGGMITGTSFKTASATAQPDTGGISVTTVKASSTVTALSFNATSDKRLKQNINEMPSQWENIKALKPSEYNWSENSKYDCGFIAQQIYSVYPHLRPKLENVIIPDENNDDCPVTLDGEPVYYTIDYGKMTPYLCKGLQEVMSETEKMRQEIAELKAQIQSLRENK